MTQLSEAYRKIRNTFRFALGNLSDFDPARDAVAEDELEELDRWMLSRTRGLVATVRELYESFDFHRVFHALHDFCVVDLSAFYFDVLKDRLYTFRSARIARGVRRKPPCIASPARCCGWWRRFWCSPATRSGIFSRETRAIRISVHLALFPGPRSCRAVVDEAPTDVGRSCFDLRGAVLMSLERRATRKQINCGARGARDLHGEAPGAAAAGYTRSGCRRCLSCLKWNSNWQLSGGRCVRDAARPSDDVHRAAGQEVRALLELFDARRGEPRLSDGVRAVRGRARGDRKLTGPLGTSGTSAPGSSAGRRELLMAARSAAGSGSVAVVAADRASKYGMEQLTRGATGGHCCRISPTLFTLNAGIAFGLFSESDFKWVSLLLVTASTVIILLLVWLLVSRARGGTASQAGLALIAGGAAGNLLDRLLYGGVTDFLELDAGNFRWPAFNLADSAITIGAVLIILDLFSGEKGCKQRPRLARKEIRRQEQARCSAALPLRRKMPAGAWTSISPLALPDVSRTRIQELIDEGRVRLGGRLARRAQRVAVWRRDRHRGAAASSAAGRSGRYRRSICCTKMKTSWW